MTLRVPANRRPITPGAVLREDFLEPVQLTQQVVADAIGVDRTTLNKVLNARRGVTPEMALRLARAFGPAPQYWLNLQTAVDLYDAQHSPKAAAIAKIRSLVSA
jgi:addiction module HigA family antidote